MREGTSRRHAPEQVAPITVAWRTCWKEVLFVGVVSVVSLDKSAPHSHPTTPLFITSVESLLSPNAKALLPISMLCNNGRSTIKRTKKNHSQMRREHSSSSLHFQQQRSAVRGCLGVTQFLKPHPSAQTMRQQNSSLQSATPPVRVHSQSQSCQNPQRSRRRSPHSSARDTPSRVTHCSFPLS